MSKLNKKTRRNGKKDGLATFEKLESRQLYSVVMATPQNFQSVIASSSAGDTISFTPGTYNIGGTAANPTGGFASGRTYVGNGAVLNNSSGAGAINFGGLSNVDFSGFTLNGVQIRADQAGNLKIHDNTFQNINSEAIAQGGMHDTQIVHNKFLHVGGQGVYGYPGDNVTVSNNTFDYVWEPVHFAATSCSNLDVSGNVITNATRIGIELQVKVNGLKVNNNWVGQWAQGSKGNGHMGLSIATGYGGNIDISGNTILQTGPGGDVGNGCAIETFGHDINIAHNYSYGWSCLILNGSEPGGLSSSNNTVVGGKLTDYDSVGGAYNIGPVHSNGDRVYSLNASNAPQPASPGSVSSGSSSSATATTTTTVSSTPAPTNLAATSPTSSEVDLSWTDKTSGKGTYILQRRATNGSDGFQTIATLATGTTSYADKGLNANWEYSYQLVSVLSGVSSDTVSAHAQVQAAPVVATPDPVVTTPAPVDTTPAPVVTAPAPVVTAPAPVVTAPAPVVTAGTSAATNFTATSPSSTEADVSWTDNSSGTATYILQRRATHGSGGFETIATLAAGTTSYKDLDVNPQWEYDYQLTAVAGGVSSTAVTAHTQVVATATVNPPVATGGTAAPTSLVAISASNSEVDLTWTDNTGGKAAYVLQRRASHGNSRFQTIATIAAGVNSYSDVHVTKNWEYDYRLVAVQAGVASPTVAAHVQVQNSSGSAVTTAVSAPAAPSLLLAASPNSTEVGLNWVDNSGGSATFVVARRASHGSEGYQVIATLAAGRTSYTDTKVTANWNYDYYLVAVVPGAASTAVTVNIQVQPMLTVNLADAA